jgi:hypothetical protein
MDQPWKHIDVEQRGDVSCVRLRTRRIDEPDMCDLANELITLGQSQGCKKVALSLGPCAPECLYSVFLAKLMTVQRRLTERGSSLVLCEASPDVQAVFDACQFTEYFQFLPDFDAAVAVAAE